MNGAPHVAPEVGHLPALVVAHDDTGAAVLDVLRTRRLDDDVHLCTAAEFDPEDLKEVMGRVGADDPFVVVHVAGPLEDTTGAWDPQRGEQVRAAAESVATALRATFPMHGATHAWLVHAVGQEFDRSERDLVGGLVAGLGLRGAIVTASVTPSATMHPADEQIVFCADAVTTLTSTPIERQLAGAGARVWAFGASSATYTPGALLTAARAFVVGEALDVHVLEELEGVAASRDLGRQEIDDLRLVPGTLPGEDEREQDERTRMLAGASGGSLLRRFRTLGIDFNTLPLREWVRTLAVTYEVLLRNELPVVEEQIASNRRRRRAQLSDRLRSLVVQEFRDTRNIDATLSFCDGLRDRLEAARRAVAEQLQEPAAAVPSQLARLRHLLRWLPFGPAVAVRVFGLALAILITVGVVLGPEASGPLGFVSHPYARLAAILVILLGAWLYQRRLSRTLRLRDRVVETLEADLVRRVENMAVEAQLATIDDLLAFVGDPCPWWRDGQHPTMPLPDDAGASLTDWVARTGSVLRSSRAELEGWIARDEGPAESSRFSLRLPTPEEVPTAEIVSEVVRNRPDPLDVADAVVRWTLEEADDDLHLLTQEQFCDLVAALPLLTDGDLPWHGAEDLLRHRWSVLQRTQRLIEHDLTPRIDDTLVRHGEMPRHYLIARGGRDGDLARMLLERAGPSPVPYGVSRELTAVEDTLARGTVAMVHLLQLDVGTSDAASGPPDAPTGGP